MAVDYRVVDGFAFGKPKLRLFTIDRVFFNKVTKVTNIFDYEFRSMMTHDEACDMLKKMHNPVIYNGYNCTDRIREI